MRRFLLLCALSSLYVLPVSGQDAPVGPAVPAATSTAAGSSPPSTLLQPSLSALQQAMSSLRPEKWKLSGEMREETAANIRSINRDLAETLPPLLATADGEPGSVAKGLPVARNIDAVYDVALRVAAVGKVGAPQQQAVALDQAITGLQSARRELDDQLEASAVAQERRVVELQTALRAAQQPAPPPAVVAPVAPVKTPVKVRRPKPRPKPAQPTATTPVAAPKQP